MKKSFYLTTPLYYVNGEPHVGHLYTTVLTDLIARYKRLSGFDVCSLTGTDEHGLKIERAARDHNVSAQELADRYSAAFYQAWDRLGLPFDARIRTTEERHHKAVLELYERINKAGYIYLDQYSGKYCVSCEAYVGDEEEKCPDCGRGTEYVSEESYFFKLSEFQGKLLDFYSDNPDFVIPVARMNEITSFVKGGLKDLSISRTSFRWGIPFPDDEEHIFYVWFDALIGYLSGVGFASSEEKFKLRWPADVQLIGKDILRFHAVYWPAFLMAAGLEPPRHILVNGWWTVEGRKMSKSLGNYFTVDSLADRFPADYLKYFLIREIPVGNDGDFSFKALINRVNSDLANDIGNLTSRTLKMIQRYFDGRIPEHGEVGAAEQELLNFNRETVQLYHENFDKLQINKALDNVWELISVANKYIVANEPWILAKSDEKKERLGTVLYCAAETVRIIAILLGPVVPCGAAKILSQLGVEKSLDEHQRSALNWGGLKPGRPIGDVEPVYPRLDPAGLQNGEKDTPSEQKSDSKGPAKRDDNRISIDDFARVEMRTAKVVSAERIPKSSKLLKLKVDLGEEIRQVVAGIGETYKPGDLEGRLVAVVVNLEPAKLMGVESNGMIVAAEDESGPVLVTFAEDVALGSRLR